MIRRGLAVFAMAAVVTGCGGSKAKPHTTAVVPKVVGITQEAAVVILHRSHLNAHLDFVVSAQPKGTTISQDPFPGTRLQTQGVVDVMVSQ